MQDQTDQAVRAGLAQAELLEQQAQETPLEPSKFHQALEAAHVAARLAPGASDAVRGRAEELVARLEREKEAVERDRRLLTALLEVRRPQEGPKYTRGEGGVMMVSAEVTAEEQFVLAFRAWGLGVDAVPTHEAAARLKQRPKAVVTEVIAGLDEWASQRRMDRKPEIEWRRLAALAAALEDDPGSKRRELREILARGRLPMERSLTVLSRMLRPVPLSVELPLGQDRLRLRELAEQTDPAAEPVLGLLTLARALRVAGEEVRAEQLLRAATQARPQNVILYHTLGKFLTEQDPPRWSDAIECYTAARALRPELGIGLADALIYSGRHREGLRLFDQLVKESPKNPYLYYMWAYALDTKGRLDDAIARLHKAIDLHPEYALAHNYLGWALNQKGQVEEAIAEYRKAITFDPKPVLAHNNLGWVLYEKGQVEEAMTHYRKAITLDPNYALAHINLGWALYNKEQIKESIVEYNKAIALDPNNSLVHNNLGLALETKGQIEEAMAEYRKAIALDPKSTWPLTNLGLVLHNKGQLDDAIACYLKALKINPKDATAHNNLGWALYNKGQFDDAIAEYHKAIAFYPNFPMAHNNLGLALYDKGRIEEAMAEYRKAIVLDSKYVKAHNNLGYALRKQGRLEEAIAEYRKAIQLKPDSANYHNDLGMTLAEYGQADEAIACYREAQELDPKDSWPHNNLGLALKQKGRLHEAIDSYRKAIELDPNNVKALSNLGEVLRDKCRYDEAILYSQKAIELDPNYVWPHYNLGQILFKQGRYAEAREAIRRSSQVSPRNHPAYQLSTRVLESWDALIAQDKKLSAVLSGKESPSDAFEMLCYAGLCQLYKNRYVAAARLYADAFATDSKIDPTKEYGYDAACSAVLAAAGHGEDARLLPDKVAVMFRRWAYNWLRADLKVYALRSRQDNPTVKEEIHQQMLRWRCDPNLAAVREPEALALLPENERTAWQSLWHDVGELAMRTTKQDKAGENMGSEKKRTP
jgi:superkiller protein 3